MYYRRYGEFIIKDCLPKYQGVIAVNYTPERLSCNINVVLLSVILNHNGLSVIYYKCNIILS